MSVSTAARGLLLSMLIAFTACTETPPAPTAVEILQVLKQIESLRQQQHEAQALEVSARFFERHAFRDLEPTAALFNLRKEHALLLMTFSRLDAAVEVLRELSLVARSDSSLSLLLGRSYARLGNHTEALQAYQRLSDATRRDELLDYGNALVNAGEETAGRAALAASLIVDPWRDAAHLALGRALVRAGQSQKARVFLARYRAAEPHRRANAEALLHERGGMRGLAFWKRGQGEMERGNLFGARERYREAVDIDRGTAEAYVGLVRVSLALDRPHDAIRLLRQLPPEAPFLALQGEALEILGDERAASGLYRQALGLDASLTEPRQGLERIADGRGLSRSDEPAEIKTMRQRVRKRTRKLDLLQSIADLVQLAEALHQSGTPALVSEAERIVLFVQQLAPAAENVWAAVLNVADRPELVFFRLQVLVQSPLFTEELDKELKSLGLDRRTLGRALEGHRLGGTR